MPTRAPFAGRCHRMPGARRAPVRACRARGIVVRDGQDLEMCEHLKDTARLVALGDERVGDKLFTLPDGAYL